MTPGLASPPAHMLSFRTVDLEVEGSYYIGTVLSAVIYGQPFVLHCGRCGRCQLISIHLTGIYLGIYCLSISALLTSTNTTRSHRIFYILFSSVLLLLNTLSFVQGPYTGLMMWIVMRNDYPGGPFAYDQFESARTFVSLLGNIAQTLGATLNDGLLAYRCYVIFGSSLYIVIFPVLCTLGALALGVAMIPLLTSIDCTQHVSKPHDYYNDFNQDLICFSEPEQVYRFADGSGKNIYKRSGYTSGICRALYHTQYTYVYWIFCERHRYIRIRVFH